MPKEENYIGLMSGTSIDAIDGVIVSFSNNQLTLKASHSIAIEPQTRQAILALCQPGENELERSAQLDRQLGLLFADCANALLAKNTLQAKHIHAIGSHGQTIRHHPDKNPSYSIQIADPNTIVQQTNITTVADFRRRDISAGGQGAPLVPPFHEFLFNDTSKQTLVVNLGGMANITLLTNDENHLLGFDTGPSNVLMDYWCNKHLHANYDIDGNWAKCGRVNTTLLNNLLNEPFFKQAPPKSTGRELFNGQWLEQRLQSLSELAPQDVQATLCALSAHSICDAIKTYAPFAQEIILCGGGVFNRTLFKAISEQLPEQNIVSSQQKGIHPQWVEACAFAWLARQTLTKNPSNEPKVTGAKSAVILGGVYYR